MKKYLYMVCIVILLVLHGFIIAKTTFGIISAIPVGFLTGVLFSLLCRECKNE
jgi:hypothetical protein